jgi:hypothetical protein
MPAAAADHALVPDAAARDAPRPADAARDAPRPADAAGEPADWRFCVAPMMDRSRLRAFKRFSGVRVSLSDRT